MEVSGNVPGKYGPHGELFFLLIQKESVVASNVVLPDPFVSAETLKACALIGLHFLAAENEAGSGGSKSPDLGYIWRHGCESGADQLLFGKRTSFDCDEYEHNNGQARW